MGQATPGSAVRRALLSYAIFRTVIDSGPLQWAIRTGRAARVARPVTRFLTGQIVHPGATGRYRLGANGAPFHLRHGTRDVDILNEIFATSVEERSYEPPGEARRELEGKPIRVLDLGGNIGLFGLFAFQRWRVEALRSFEPDPDNAAVLRATVAANDGLPWSVEEAAISNSSGTLRFRAGLFADARAADEDEQAVQVAKVDLFERDLACTLLKIDIEGGEWSLLGDPRFREIGARAIVLEWHQRGCPESDARRTARRLLNRAGYRVVKDDAAAHGENGILWALRRHTHG